MSRHSPHLAFTKHIDKRQFDTLSPTSPSTNTPTDSTSSTPTTSSPKTPTDSSSTADFGPTPATGSTTGTGTTGTGSTPGTTSSTTNTDPNTTGSNTTGSNTTGSTTTGPTSGTGLTASGNSKSGSSDSLDSSPLISLNPLSALTSSPATPTNAKAAPVASAAPNRPSPVPTLVSSVVNQSHASSIPTLSTNPAGVVVTQTIYPKSTAAVTNGFVAGPATSVPTSAPTAAPTDETGTSVGTIMGIVVAALIGAVILGGVVGMFFKRKKQRMMDDYDDNPFLNDKYGTQLEPGGSPSVDAHGLNRTMTGATRTGGATGPRPPSILERHWGAPSLPTATFQPGQVVNNSAAQFASLAQFNPGYPVYPGQQIGGYGAEQAAYGAIHGSPSSYAAYGNEAHAVTGLQREPSGTSHTEPPSFDSHAYPCAPQPDQKESSKAQVAPLDFSLGASGGSGRLKNPYETDDALRSGSPVQPNIQQSYFAHSYPDSFTNSPETARPAQPREVRDQRTLSVINGHPMAHSDPTNVVI